MADTRTAAFVLPVRFEFFNAGAAGFFGFADAARFGVLGRGFAGFLLDGLVISMSVRRGVI
jgi:hypothetical protein